MAKLEHKEALELIGDDWLADDDNRIDALHDLRFLAGDQWDETERQQRESEGRPCLSIPQLHTFVNQVAGDIRQAQPGIEVYPVDSKDDIPLANIYEGLIRQIEYQSGATSVYSYAAECAIRCGIGHLRLETEYTNDSVFEQDIKIKRIIDPLSVVWDAGAVELDRSDAKHCWVTDWIHKNEWKRRFAKSGREGSDVPIDRGYPSSQSLYWRREDFIRIAEYWCYKPVKRTLIMTPEGKTFDITDWSEFDVSNVRASGMVAREREVDAFKVTRQVMDGVDWLSEPDDWAGRFIPIIPCIGSEVAFDGRIVRAGLIRWAKDSQKLYNFWASATAELIGKSPKAPWLVTPNMIKGFEGYWNNANRSNLPFLPHNIDPANPNAKPERQQPPQSQPGMWQERALAREDLRHSTGIYDAGLGAQGNETSGKAILARQREGDVGSFYFLDNFAIAVGRVGRQLVDLIPRIYDSERQVRILGIDGSEAFVPINQTVQTVDGQTLLINDLSDGRFDVRVKLGASYTTSRVEAREQMAIAMQGNPDLWAVIGDLYFKNSDYPGAEEIAARLRRAVDPKLLEDQPQGPDPMQQAMMQLTVAAEDAKIDETVAKTRKTIAEIDKVKAETQKIGADTVVTLDRADDMPQEQPEMAEAE
jgi:hypothetical protein